MENITHLWNTINYLRKFNEKSVNELLTYYVHRCGQQGKTVELPKEYFGPRNICFNCGSLWTRIKHRNRLIPGKLCSNVLKTMTGTVRNDKKVSKCLRSKINKVVIKCSVCSKNTEITCNKPVKKKCTNQIDLNDTEAERFIIKKKKRRSRDKTAGLNISCSEAFSKSLSAIGSPNVNKNSSPLHQREKKRNETPVTPLDKLKKINKEKLDHILREENTKKRNSLTNFLKELY